MFIKKIKDKTLSREKVKQRLWYSAVSLGSSAGITNFMISQAFVSDFVKGVFTGIEVVMVGFSLYFLGLLKNKSKFEAFYNKYYGQR
ncbi:hypothetical protein [Streptococcus dentiloxodontae]